MGTLACFMDSVSCFITLEWCESVHFLCSVYYKPFYANQQALQCDTCAYAGIIQPVVVWIIAVMLAYENAMEFNWFCLKCVADVHNVLS